MDKVKPQDPYPALTPDKGEYKQHRQTPSTKKSKKKAIVDGETNTDEVDPRYQQDL